MQKEKPAFEVIPNWRRYSELIPREPRIDPGYAVAVNQMALSALCKQTTLVAASPPSPLRHRRPRPNPPSKLPPRPKLPASIGLPKLSVAGWVTIQLATLKPLSPG